MHTKDPFTRCNGYSNLVNCYLLGMYFLSRLQHYSGADEEVRGWDWELIENQIPNVLTLTQIITVSHSFQFQCDIQLGSRQLSMPRTETNALIFHVRKIRKKLTVEG
jgi:hypothetical protein